MWKTLGRSNQKRPLRAWVSGDPAMPCRIVFGGFHGDEPKSVDVAERFITSLQDAVATKSSTSEAIAAHHWVVLPLVNPDGFEIRNRRNARRVDINRNFPTSNFEVGRSRSRMYGGPKPASESETRAVMRIIERFSPASIITIHSISGNRYCNNYDGPARTLANRMKKANGYPVAASIGYPTPGSFGSWAGIERSIPTVTLELPSHHSGKRCWLDNQDALLVKP
ncbi:MAG: M14 family zinc carboxypeptidase [Phycisphaerae bacterium]